jgi:hypothetical protein
MQKNTFCLFFSVVFVLCFAKVGQGQINRYWSQNFNDGSSMLAGAVVGGDAGVAAIFYNPANISEITESRFSMSLSLVSVDMYQIKNALGKNDDLRRIKLTRQPRFASYMIELKKNKRISLEVAFMNVANSNVRFALSEDKVIDIIKSLQGDEHYFADYSQENVYKDDYVGVGASYTVNEKLSFGSSVFVSIKTLRTQRGLELNASPLTDSVYRYTKRIAAYTASYNQHKELRFQNYSMLFKFGMNYKIGNVNLGINVSTPSLDLFTGGKYLNIKRQQSNINNPDNDSFLPDYTIVSQQDKNDLKVRYKTPFSIAVGATFHSPSNPDQSFFITAEYFSSVAAYDIIDANPYQYFFPVSSAPDSAHLLDFEYGARDILNVAIGYRWQISPRFLLLSGFKTDFNCLENVKIDNERLDNFNLSLYHITSGLRIKNEKSVILMGIQYSFGGKDNLMQIANIADPVEYNVAEKMALQGTRDNSLKVSYQGLSFFLGATFNFKGKK